MIQLHSDFIFGNGLSLLGTGVPRELYIHWNRGISNIDALRMYIMSLHECIYECKLRPGCTSINYKIRGQLCKLNDNIWVAETQEMHGVVFSKREDWTKVIYTFSKQSTIMFYICTWETLL